MKKKIYMVESEDSVNGVLFSKKIICHVCWNEINSKLISPKATVFLGCFSYRSLV